MLAAVAPARPAAAATAAPRAAARASSGRRGCRRAACMAVAGEDKLISKAPIPEKLPRDDFVDHIFKWATIEFSASGDYTVPMRVEPVPGELYNKGFTVWICQIDENGREQDVTAVRFQFDENEEEFLMIKVATGVEVTQGEAELVQTLKNVAQATAAAIDSYYTFGSAMDGGEDF